MADQNTSSQNPPPQEHYGFVFYRAESIDDAQWERFMAFLKYQVRHSLASEGNPQFYDEIDWKVFDAHGETTSEIRHRFNRWLETGEESTNPENYRYLAFVVVYKISCDFVDQFMEGKSLQDDDAVDERDTTFLAVVSRDEEEGETLVSIPYLIPRAGDIIALQGEGMGWQLLQEPFGRIATSRTEFDRLTLQY
ncbi:hypothetical protein PMIN03_008190 [Paraphaeosphaeria minitans]|uniref:Uncharacterized protein n=1 Tax=Paraphaeosphaeria minitans TaxID=565426 RepID=A0A9P6GHE7_9PLEO|nr:hypothetical protein PMIN01_07077 [Paraphaeosphaeria minitans]